jgi:hypothetical protein
MRRTAMIRRLAVLAVTVLAMVAFASPAAWAATFTVDTTQDRIPVPRSCTSDPNDCTLRGAIEKSDANGQTDTINFALPAGPQTITLGDALTVANNTPANDLTINGPGQDLLTVKQSAAVRVFQIVGKTTIKGITISGGRSINNAGGILNGGNLTLNDTTVTDNQALGTVAKTGDGGGIYNASGATLTLNRSTVSANIANTPTGDGGGIHNASGGTVTLSDSAVSGNDANDNGGGVRNLGTLTLNRSTVSGNEATSGDGGGIYSLTNLTDLTTTISNSTISGNAAGDEGGGIFNIDGLTRIENSTITKNTAASGAGGGVASYGDATTRTEVLSTIIAANTNDNDVQLVGGSTNTFQSFGYNLIGGGNAADSFNKTGDQRGIPDPRLGLLVNNGGLTQTHAVLKGSRAIDRGALRGGCPKTDQRGQRRPQNGDGKGTSRCDIGAFEKKAVRR